MLFTHRHSITDVNLLVSHSRVLIFLLTRKMIRWSFVTHQLMDSQQHRLWCRILNCWCKCFRKNFGRSMLFPFVVVQWVVFLPQETVVHDSNNAVNKNDKVNQDYDAIICQLDTHLSILIGIWWIKDFAVSFYGVRISRCVVVIKRRFVTPRLS